MDNFFDTVVFVVVVLESVATAATAIGSKSYLLIDSSTVVARPFFFGIWDTLVEDRFIYALRQCLRHRFAIHRRLQTSHIWHLFLLLFCLGKITL